MIRHLCSDCNSPWPVSQMSNSVYRLHDSLCNNNAQLDVRCLTKTRRHWNKQNNQVSGRVLQQMTSCAFTNLSSIYIPAPVHSPAKRRLALLFVWRGNSAGSRLQSCICYWVTMEAVGHRSLSTALLNKPWWMKCKETCIVPWIVLTLSWDENNIAVSIMDLVSKIGR